MSIYSVLGVPNPEAEAEADNVTDAEVAEMNEMRRQFGLPEMTPEAAADAVREHRARMEDYKERNPELWAEAEDKAQVTRDFMAARRRNIYGK